MLIFYYSTGLTTSSTTSTTTSDKPDTTIFPARTEDIKQQMKPAETMLGNMNTIQGDSVLIGSDFDFSNAKKELAQDTEGKEDSNFVLGFVGKLEKKGSVWHRLSASSTADYIATSLRIEK